MRAAARILIILLTLLVACGLCIACRSPSAWDVDQSLTGEEPLGDNLVLRRTSGGYAGIDWEGVEILQRDPGDPRHGKSLYSVRIGDAGDCDEKTVHVTPDIAAELITIRCGTSPYVYGRVPVP